MSCFHPLIREPQLFYEHGVGSVPVVTSTGEVVYRVRAVLPGEVEGYLRNGGIPAYKSIIPCGHCIGCKLDHSREWADRMVMELNSSGSGIFVTLTYAPEYIPPSYYTDNNGCQHGAYTLRKKDVQDWLKRLRRMYDGSRSDYPVRHIRYYLCGEYGEMTLRPHYHAILFGLSLDDVQAVPALTPLGKPVTNDMGDAYYQSPVLASSWSFGLVSCSEVTWRTCAYVARYVTKKWSSGFDSKSKVNLYELFNVQPEFSLMSRKPGIGSDFLQSWMDSHPTESILDYSKLSVSDSTGGKSIRVPKYIKRKFKDSPYPELRAAYSASVERALAASESRMILQLAQTDNEYLAVLQAAEDNLKSRTRVLTRDKV